MSSIYEVANETDDSDVGDVCDPISNVLLLSLCIPLSFKKGNVNPFNDSRVVAVVLKQDVAVVAESVVAESVAVEESGDQE